MNPETKFFAEPGLNRQFFSKNLTKRFFVQPESHKNNDEMLRFSRRRRLEAIFHLMRVAVNDRKGQNQLKKNTLHLERTLARPPLYDRAYPRKLWTAFPGNPVGVTRPSLISLFKQLDKTTLEDPTSTKGIFFDNFRQKNV